MNCMDYYDVVKSREMKNKNVNILMKCFFF